VAGRGDRVGAGDPLELGLAEAGEDLGALHPAPCCAAARSRRSAYIAISPALFGDHRLLDPAGDVEDAGGEREALGRDRVELHPRLDEVVMEGDDALGTAAAAAGGEGEDAWPSSRGCLGGLVGRVSAPVY
jgi:hypothetical protein